jgi:hypothetical protein
MAEDGGEGDGVREDEDKDKDGGEGFRTGTAATTAALSPNPDQFDLSRMQNSCSFLIECPCTQVIIITTNRGHTEILRLRQNRAYPGGRRTSSFRLASAPILCFGCLSKEMTQI